jgi:hypothetical protein
LNARRETPSGQSIDFVVPAKVSSRHLLPQITEKSHFPEKTSAQNLSFRHLISSFQIAQTLTKSRYSALESLRLSSN